MNRQKDIMRLRQHIIPVLLAALAVVVAACSSDVEPYGEGFRYGQRLYAYAWDLEEFNVEHTQSISVEAPEKLPWTASSNESWITINSRGEHVGPGSIDITVADNPSTNRRRGTVNLNTSRFGEGDYITVYQAGSYFKINGSSSDTYWHGALSDSGTEFILDGNVSWSVSDKPSWVSTSSSSGEPGKETLVLAANSHNLDDDRSGNVQLRTALGTYSIYVSQGSEFDATMDNTNYAAEGDFWGLKVKAPSAQSWTVSSNRSWVKFSTTSYSTGTSTYSGTGNASVSVIVDENSDSQERSATITIKAGTATRTVEITQNAIKFDAKMYTTTFSGDGGDNNLYIAAAPSRSWSVTSNRSWITFSPSSGYGSATVKVTAAANTSTSTRYATITVKSGTETWTMTVTQDAPIAFDISMSTTYYKPEGDYWNVSVQAGTSQSWTASSSRTWATLSPTSGTGNKNVTVTCSANNGSSVRTATITVTAGSQSKTKTITQGYYATYSNWTSANHTDYSSTDVDRTLSGIHVGDVLRFKYDISSEANYDKFYATLLKNGSTVTTLVDGASGVKSNNSVTYTFDSSGTYTLNLKYSKDGSISRENDNVKVYDIKVEHKQ